MDEDLRGTAASDRCWVAGAIRDRTATAELQTAVAMCTGCMDPSWETVILKHVSYRNTLCAVKRK